MSTTQLQKHSKGYPGAVLFKYVFKKMDIIRYLPKVVEGFVKFNASGVLIATDSPVIAGNLKFAPAATPSALATAGAGTITAAMLLNGLLTRDCAGAGRADATDTAANIISALTLTANYQEKFCTIHNISAGNFTSTLSGGTGVTLKGAITVEQNTAIKIGIMRTSGTTVAIRQC